MGRKDVFFVEALFALAKLAPALSASTQKASTPGKILDLNGLKPSVQRLRVIKARRTTSSASLMNRPIRVSSRKTDHRQASGPHGPIVGATVDKEKKVFNSREKAKENCHV